MEHQHLCFEDSLVAQWEVDSHLVAIEVGVERCTSQWVKLDSLTLDELRLESLYTKAVERRSTVEEHRVSLHYILQDVPNNWFATVYNLLGTLHSLHNTTLDELTNNEWLVKFGCHKLRKTAFAHLQFRTYNDNRTC